MNDLMKLRVALISATYPPYLSGTGLVVYHNARELARRGHRVTVWTTETPSAASPDIDGVTVRRLRPLVRAGNAALLPQLYSRLTDYDLIHFHYPFLGGEVAALAARRHKIPLVITYHQDVHLTGWRGFIEKGLRYTAGRSCLRSAASVLFTTRDYSEASYARRLLRGREHTIGELPNGVDADTFYPTEKPTHLLERLGMHTNQRIALLVAGLDRAHYFKGVPVFLEAVKRLPDDLHAVIVGEGDLRQEYMARAAELEISGRVHFTGRVAWEELPDHYRLADMTVLPSITMGEAFGMVLIESMACGTPVIASNLPGVRSVVTPSVDGYLAAPGNVDDLVACMQRMLQLGNAERQSMGQAGRSKVLDKYTWEKIGDKLEVIYGSVLEAPA